MLRRTFGKSAVGSLAAACAGLAGASSQARDRAFLHRLRSTSPKSPDGDLMFLRPIVEGKKIIGLGEATHGSHEIFEIKTRLVRWLVTRWSAGILALELGFADGRTLDRYVTGRSDQDLKSILTRIQTFSIANKEFMNLIQGIHDLNRRLPLHQMTRIFGYDIQKPGREAMMILEWLARNDPQSHVAVGASFRNLADQPDKSIQAYPPTSAADVQRDVALLKSALASRRMDLERRTDRASLWEVDHAVEVIGQGFDLFSAPSMQAAYDLRDAAGARNIMKLQKEDPRALIVWAHNGHINKGSYEFAGAPLLGGYLKQASGDRYFAIATAFYGGDVRAAHRDEGVIVNHLPPARDGSVDAFLNKRGPDIFFADLRTAKQEKEWRWLEGEGVMRGVGGGYEPEIDRRTYRPTRLFEQFDAIAFVRHVTVSAVLD